MALKKNLKEALSEVKEMIRPLQSLYEQYMMKGDIDSAHETMSKIMKEKEKYVLQAHMGKNDEPRKINPPQEGGKGPLRFWNTMIPGKNRITGATYEELIAKLYVYYGGDDPKPQSYQVRNLWEKAIDAYATNPNIAAHPKTVRENKLAFEFLATKMKGFTTEDELQFPDFLDADLRVITESVLAEYLCLTLKAQKDAKTPVTEKAFLNFKGTLNILYGYATRKGYVSINYAKGVTPLHYAGIKVNLDYSLKKRDRSDVMHTEEEYRRMFEKFDQKAKSLKNHGYYVYHLMARFQDLTGVRPGELCAAKKKYDHGTTLRICEAFDSTKALVDYTKNERRKSLGGRFVPICTELRRVIDASYALQERFGLNSEFIFCDSEGKPIQVLRYIDYIGNTLDTLGIKRHGSYTFRRDYNDHLVHDKICPLSSVDRGKVVGNSGNVNYGHYTHEEESYLSNARDIFERSSKHWQIPEEPSQDKAFDD